MSFREGAQTQASAQNGTFWKTTSVLRLRWDFFGVDSSEASGLASEHMDFVGGSEVDATKRCMMQCVHRECHMPTNGNAVEKDLFHRSLEAIQPSDLYIAGFPCPAYSALGKKNGAQDGHARKRPSGVRGLEIHCGMETASCP